MNHPLATYLKRFFSHYLPVQKGLSPHAVTAYRDAVKLLLCYAADTLKLSVDALTVEAITAELVLNFLDHLQQVRGCQTPTRNARLAAVRSLFTFIAREEPVLMPQCQVIRSIPLKRCEHKTVAYLGESEMQAILDAVDIDSRTGLRDRALLLILYNTGARVSEIVGFTCDDLRLDTSAQIKILGKGRKQRSCPLWPETAKALQAYLQQRNPTHPATEQVFLNANGLPITRFGVRYVIRKYAALALPPCASTKAVNPHTIRHTTAMHLLRAGNDINMVSFWLGHANINTTHIYVEIDMEMKRKMIEKAGPPNVDFKPPWQRPDILLWLQNLTKQPQLCAVNRKILKV